MKRNLLNWRNKSYKRLRIIVILAVLFIAIMRFSVWSAIINANSQAVLSNFNSAANDYVAQLQSQFEIYANILYSSRALFTADQTVSRQDWENFISSQNLSRRYPAIYGVAYARASSDPARAIITYLSPESSTDQKVIGYDLLTSDVRATTLGLARDSGLVRAGPPLALQGDEANAPPSVLLVIATYNPGAPTDTIAERQAALSGYVLIGLHTKTLLDSIFNYDQADSAGLGVKVSTAGQIIYSQAVSQSARHLEKETTINIAGQTWNLYFSAPPDYDLNATSKLAPTVLIVSVTPLVLLLGLIVYYGIAFERLRSRQHDSG